MGDAGEKLAEDYAALNKADLAGVVDASIAVAAAVVSYQKIGKEVSASIDNNIRYCEAQAKNYASQLANLVDDDKGKKEAKDMGEQDAAKFGAVSAAVRVIVSKLPAAAFSTVVAAADLVEANVTNFKAEEKAKA